LIITLVFEKNANIFAENCRKSQKNVIITSTPETEQKFSFLFHAAMLKSGGSMIVVTLVKIDGPLNCWVQNPVVTYDIVTYYIQKSGVFTFVCCEAKILFLIKP
jgi:hypothetical protein